MTRVEHDDLQSGSLDERRHVLGQLATATGKPLYAVQPALPPGHPGVGGEAVLEEVQPPTGSEQTDDLAQCPRRVRHGAEGERDQGRVIGPGRVDRLTVRSEEHTSELQSLMRI